MIFKVGQYWVRAERLACLLAIAIAFTFAIAFMQTAVAQQIGTEPQTVPADRAAINHQLHQTILKEHTGFKVGKNTDGGGPTYVFFDPQCEHCMDLWQQAKPLAEKYELTWIPVNVLGEKSMILGAALVGSKTPVKLMNQHQKLRAEGKAGIGPAASKLSTKAMQDKVRTNFILLQKLGFDSVPLVARYDEKTKTFSADLGSMTTKGLEDLLKIK